ncbi:Uncharacterized protein ChrSV_0216 [Chromobacterium vaccinii]|nr:Uncharacterized protein ChrSW_0216 [Chromobacterium vaccinii]QND87675.1 Uncharacterized protein ChrSV_0216 [Chromobacterium vaccinii]
MRPGGLCKQDVKALARLCLGNNNSFVISGMGFVCILA